MYIQTLPIRDVRVAAPLKPMNAQNLAEKLAELSATYASRPR